MQQDYQSISEQIAQAMLIDQHRLRLRLRALRDAAARGSGGRDPLDRLIRDVERSRRRRDERLAGRPKPTYPPELPVVERREEIARVIAANQVVVVCGETGSGKTTQLPKICLELGRGVAGMIGHTQPRRIAARSVAARIAQELGTPLGQAVGFKVRFTDQTSPSSYIKVMTDGILLAETQGDRFLEQYDTIIIDEAHERGLNIDFLLGYLRRLLPRRPDLKLIITSATIDPKRFSDHFGKAPVIEVSGRVYPVEVRYRPRMGDVGEEPEPPLPSEGEGPRKCGEGLDLPAEDQTEDKTLTRSGGSPGVPGEERTLTPALSLRRERGKEPSDARDMTQAILDAVDELAAEGPGDMLVFLSGEREIRETAEALRRHRVPGDGAAGATEVLPLYARLSAGEQNRIFQPHPGRRIVLATNVAETSLTVPGVRYVIDPGYARISRYSARSKVQRLPIEAVSRASADQRKGRCGRVAAGVCVRLYAEDDYNSRPAFTQPDILRANLAGVILQMKALNLGNVEDFPFIDPPDPRRIRDGYDTLLELGAVDPRNGELTALGRDLSRLPIDPRIGRMILAGREEKCLPEVLVIAAALSVQDPRERPLDRQALADQAHAQFRDETSDFLSFLRLWNAYHEQLRTLSRSQSRKWCAANFLSFIRMREWLDIHAQLHSLVSEMGLDSAPSPLRGEGRGEGPRVQTGRAPARADRSGRSANSSPQIPGRYPHPSPLPERERGQEPRQARGPEGWSLSFQAAIHRAVMTGLLSNIGNRARENYEYTGARGGKFHIFPGSALFKTTPRWVVAAELVETTRLYARTVAKILPEWIEPLAGHLVQRTYSEPRWDPPTGYVRADEKVTLYGLVIVPRRSVHYGAIDPKRAREIFIRCALVEGQYQTRAPFFDHNAALVHEVRTIEAKQRKRDLLVDEQTRFAFYNECIPPDVCNGPAFERWRRRAERHEPRLLFMSREDLMVRPAEEVTAERFPDAMPTGQAQLPLAYTLEPGEAVDGLTLTVPLAAINQLSPQRMEWLVPGLLEEKVIALIRTLPKDVRRHLIPLSQVAKDVIATLRFGEGSLLEALSEQVGKIAGMVVPRDAWQPESLPNHLRMNIRVVDEKGESVAMGRDLARLQADLAIKARESFAKAAEQGSGFGVQGLGSRNRSAESRKQGDEDLGRFSREVVTRWDFGDLPERVEFERGGITLYGYPALIDKVQSVSLRLMDSAEAARRAMRAGLRRLFLLNLSDELRQLKHDVPELDDACVRYASRGTPQELRDDLLAAIVERVFLAGEPDVRTHMEFELRLRERWHRMRPVAQDVCAAAGQLLAECHGLMLELSGPKPTLWAAAIAEMQAQLGELMPRGFIAETPPERLAHYPRYLKAMRLRLRKLASKGVEWDRAGAAEVAPLWQQYAQRLGKHRAQGIEDPALEEYRWMLEEFRVSLFAQELRTIAPVSAKRLEKLWASVRE